MRVVLAGGGTGGHLYPGIAVAEVLDRICPQRHFEFWGAGRAVEAEILAREGFEHTVLPSAPVPKRVLGVPRFLFSIASGYFAARRRLKSEAPDVMVGLGGYSSFPALLAASHLGIPTVLLEQNAVPGKATRKLARRADLVCLSWEVSRERLPRRAKAAVTGNPLRSSLVEAAKGHAFSSSGDVLVLGGSSGAVGLNTLVLDALPVLELDGRRIVHQAGAADEERVRASYEAAGVEARVHRFICDITTAYASASLVIARAGGTTLAELAVFGLPSILVPYPHHRDYHQMANARIFEEAGAAEIIEESDGAGRLAERANSLFSSLDRLEVMHAASLALGRLEAAGAVAAEILELAKKGR